MFKIVKLHAKAMDLYEEALAHKFHNNLSKYQELTAMAFELESEAANMLIDELGFEPTRGKLFASAATMAFHCGKLKEANDLIKKALHPDCPEAVKDELADLAKRISLSRIKLDTDGN